jgi:hypothetical protein
VRMTDRRGELAFAQKPRALVGVLQPAPQHFQRDASSTVHVLGLVDLAHPAAAEQTSDAIRSPRLAVSELRYRRVRDGCASTRRHRQRIVQRGVRKRFRSRSEQTRSAETFRCLVAQSFTAPGTQPWQVSDVLHAGIRQNRVPRLRAERPHEIANFVVHVFRIRDGFGDVLAERRLELAAQTVNGGFHRAFTGLETCRDCRIASRWIDA